MRESSIHLCTLEQEYRHNIEFVFTLMTFQEKNKQKALTMLCSIEGSLLCFPTNLKELQGMSLM